MKCRLRMTVTACAATTLFVAGGVAAAAAQPPASPNLASHIVYTAPSGGIWLINGDGTDNHEISTVVAQTVSFSPDGHKIAYTTQRAVWVTSVNGGAARRVVHTSFAPADVAWSPNGKWLAFDASLDANNDNRAIFRVAATGGTPRRITFGAAVGCDEVFPAWSPNGSILAFSERDAPEYVCPHPGLAVQRTGQPEDVIVPGYFTGPPSFTPVGNLVYIGPCSSCSGAYDGYEIHADGTGRTPIEPLQWDCQPLSPCWGHIIGAPRTHGWIAQSFQGDPGHNDLICFQGGYQKAGVVDLVGPSFCMDNDFSDFDAS